MVLDVILDVFGGLEGVLTGFGERLGGSWVPSRLWNCIFFWRRAFGADFGAKFGPKKVPKSFPKCSRNGFEK